MLEFNGYIKQVKYKAFLSHPLKRHEINTFDVNTAKTYGEIGIHSGTIAYSKWVTPKRTRSYPFERIYNTYNSPKVLTIIPIIKDEGQNGDFDRVQYSTFSWMNLLNIYVVLGYYFHAEKSYKKDQEKRNKITGQKFDSIFVNEQINEIAHFKQSALHWNKNLIEERFVDIYSKAIAAYKTISQTTGVALHLLESQQDYLKSIEQEFANFKDISLRGSLNAAQRESKTNHQREFLEYGEKAIFHIRNYLGGIYHLTADEVIYDGNSLIIQESKNTSLDFLPSVSDIKDGLFKLILFENLDSLEQNGTKLQFVCRLKLTGANIHGKVILPCDPIHISKFLAENRDNYSAKHEALIEKLNKEATNNAKLSIEIGRNIK